MSIYILCKDTEKEISGISTTAGRAYKLIRTFTGEGFIGSVYISTLDVLVNLKDGGIRYKTIDDRYVEVDLEIHVKDK